MNPLDEHRIQSISTRYVRLNYPRFVAHNSGWGPHGTGTDARIRIIRTDQGAMGWGWSLPYDEEADPFIAQILGRRVSELFSPAIGVIADEARFLDIPLYDLAGVILDQPVYEMLGAWGPRSTPCYDAMIYMDDLWPEENPRGLAVIEENCRHDYDLGYRAFKLKIGRGRRLMDPEAGLRRDVEATKLVHEQFPDCAILVDGNNGFTVETFLRYLEGTNGCPLYWIEEPFQENREDLLRLKQYLDRHMPGALIADGEAGFDRELLFQLAGEGLVNVFLPDILGYGFTEWRRLMPEMIDNKVFASPHAWGDALKTFYVSHLAAGLGNVNTIEGIPCTSDDVDLSQYKLVDGKITPPRLPGFGIGLIGE